MLRAVGVTVIVLLCGAVYGQLVVPQIPDLSNVFGPNCTVEDQMTLFQCSRAMQNQINESAELFQQFAEIVMSGNMTEQQAQVPLDAICSMMSGIISCLYPIAGRCFTTPLMAWSFSMYDDMLQICAAPDRDKYFVEVLRCNKKLDAYNLIANDPQLPIIIQEMTNLTLASMGPNMSNVSGIMDLPPHLFNSIYCRMISRVEEIVSVEKVNATCGADAHIVYTSLYKHAREMYNCNEQLGHNTTIRPVVGNTTISVGQNDTTAAPATNTTAPVLPPSDATVADNTTVTGAPATNTTVTVFPPSNTTVTPATAGNTSFSLPINPPTTSNPNAAILVQPGNGAVLYSLFAIMMAIVLVHRQD